MNLAASSFVAASASQARLKDAYLGGLKDELQENSTQKKEQVSEESDDEPWYYKPVAQIEKACGKALAGETAEASSAFKKSQKNKDATMDHFFAIYGSRLRHGHEDLRKTIRRSYGRSDS